jgi:hypothetical protein
MEDTPQNTPLNASVHLALYFKFKNSCKKTTNCVKEKVILKVYEELELNPNKNASSEAPGKFLPRII